MCLSFVVALFVFYFLRANEKTVFFLFLIRLWMFFCVCWWWCSECVWVCVWLCLYVKPVCILLREINHLANQSHWLSFSIERRILRSESIQICFAHTKKEQQPKKTTSAYQQSFECTWNKTVFSMAINKWNRTVQKMKKKQSDVLDKISDSVSLHGNGRTNESNRDRMNDLERIDDDDGDHRYSSDIRWKLNYTRIHATYCCCCLIFVVAVAVCIPFFSPSSSLEHFSFNIFRWLFVASAWET